MKARGKREAKRSASPLVQVEKTIKGLKGRNTPAWYYALSGLERFYYRLPGATRSASLRACPWLSYLAPLALRHTSPLALRHTSPLALRHTSPLALRHTSPLALRYVFAIDDTSKM